MEPSLSAVELTMRFGPNEVLHGVSMAFYPGRVHAIVGENGAGKSTLLKILSGGQQPSSGRIEVDGEPVTLRSPQDALARGITVVHQELALFPDLRVSENICIDALAGRWGMLNKQSMAARASAALGQVGAAIPVDAYVSDLTVAQKQFVEIARALAGRARVLMLDEPTAALGPDDTETLLATVGRLKKQGTTIAFISHRLEEVLAIADDISVLRDGNLVSSGAGPEYTSRRLISDMIGHDAAITQAPSSTGEPDEASAGREPVLTVSNLYTRDGVFDASLTLHSGELLGLYGLDGNGQDELIGCLAGLSRPARGTVTAGSRRLRRGTRSAIDSGVGYIPPDRKVDGLFLDTSGVRNITAPVLKRLSRGLHIRRSEERRLGSRLAGRVGLRGSVAANARTLSGGNQQKLLIARLLAQDSKILLLNRPTRGVDVAAREEIYRQIRQLCHAGCAALVGSPDIPELLELCRKVIVVSRGRIVGEVDSSADDANARILELATGIREVAA